MSSARGRGLPRVLAYTDADGIGGAEVVMATLVRAFGDRVELTVAGTDARVVDFLVRECPGVPTRLLPPVRGKTDLRSFIAHVRLIEAVRPDILHANLPHPWTGQYAIAAARLVRGTRVVAAEHSPRTTASALQRRLRRLVEPCIHAHVTVGDASARTLEAMLGLPAGAVRVIPNGVPDIAIQPEPRLRAAPTVGFVGRLAAEKGADVLLRALGELPGISGVLVGDGPDRAALTALVDRLGLADRVVMAGWRDRPRDLLPGFDVVAVPSRIESFGLVCVEAMLARRPVVAADVGSVREVVQHGETGLLVPPEDPAALAGALRSLLEDPDRAARMGERGRAVAIERFGATRMADAYLDLYAEVRGR